ncbi:hypothetical protein AVEN_186012-1 [Araneus ventricosus]|uniref:Uncharacterized protein n=1 Tax=Araneus ventricosus TaxID=182803 RepID=A0A4Y2BDX6_ARAVE|nr:hypothetical protein AVEN_74877-1 [Araneus ventricosus]GBL90006.1 hypothetical protein AVEN_113111-1 [Araneus ventricosus]GBL90034.1 hypothetical protein AVEN_180743-1 [Araneus ventricosus]GBL90039.1 hypothetical protein AVEN_186012-1 [Araneus ventricosus]
MWASLRVIHQAEMQCVIKERAINGVMFSLPASTVPTRKRVQFLSCQPQTTGQLHLVVVKETFARVIASRRKATTMHRNQYLSQSAYGVDFEEISGTLSCHACIAPVVAKPKNLPYGWI